MRCDEFKKYLLESGRTTSEEIDGAALAHVDECASCRVLLAMEERLEKALRRGLKKVAVPERLLSRIEQDVQGMEEKKINPFFKWKMAMPALAMAMLVLVMLFPFTGDISSPGKLAQLAIDNHMKNYSMTFEATQVSDIPGWFIGKLDFNIRMPEMVGESFGLVGGRKCSLGSKDVAYLFYNENGRRASLFMLDPADISFDMENDRVYELTEKQKDVSFWKDEALVYVLVKSAS